MAEDMKEKVFKQLTGMDAVLVTPCTACETCRAQTDRMAEQDLLEFEALHKTVSFDNEVKRYKGDFLYLEDKVKRVKNNSNFAKRNSINLHRKLSKLPANLVNDFDEAMECAKEMGALKKTSDVEGLNEGYPQRHIPINFAFSGKESSTKIRPTFNCGWSEGNGDLSFNDLHITGPRNLNNLDQSITGDQNQTLWISVLLNHTLHCNALKQMLFVVFFSQIQLYKKIRNPPNLTDVWILDKIQYSLVTTLQCKGKLHFSQV